MDTIALREVLEIVGIVITVGVAQVATLRWLLGRLTDVDTRSQERDEEIKGMMLTREEFLSHMAVYGEGTKGVRDELHRLNGRIDNLILMERRRLSPERHHEG